ncbi:unnamed protein product, partial [Prorocentrum cordatum]
APLQPHQGGVREPPGGASGAAMGAARARRAGAVAAGQGCRVAVPAAALAALAAAAALRPGAAGAFAPPPRALGRRRALAAAGLVLAPVLPGPCLAAGPEEGKRRGLPADELAAIVREDLVKRQFLATADFTRSVYDESCIFTDEIDAYPIDKFVQGTQKLFVAEESNVNLVGDVEVLDGGRALQFRFDETLAVNLPLVHPKWLVKGTCTLTRGDDGLITAYRERWDQTPLEVILNTRL